MSTRDEFLPTTKALLAQQAGYLCSHPECRRLTIGPNESGDGVINIGEAAHITAAAKGGPRYDPNLSSEERKSLVNGIWLCRNHAKEVDSDQEQYTIKTLREWKNTANNKAFDARTTGKLPIPQGMVAVGTEIIELLGIRDTDVEKLIERMKKAAQNDIDKFKALPGWPIHAVALSMQTVGSEAPTFDAAALARAIAASGEATIVAPPGTGKSTTCIQIVEALLCQNDIVSVLIPLNEWSAQPHGFLVSLSHRAPFNGIREQDFQAAAARGSLAIVLDAWNELDPTSRRKAAAEIDRLRRDLPLLQIIVSTRRQLIDVPLNGPVVEIQPLSEKQQIEIARAVSGDVGEKLLNRAWQEEGLRELVSIPLYLTALLQVRHDSLPDSKEEVLTLFIAASEKSSAEALRDGLYGLHGDILCGLAVEATVAANTAISDARSRTIVAEVEVRLKSAGQITEQPQPAVVLELLVNHHVLMRIGGSGGVSFQHEQIQEWYASLKVEDLMRSATEGTLEARAKLRRDILNNVAWEEAILFACERLSRADKAEIAAAAILDALYVDPMLAAEMIFRSSDNVWAEISRSVQEFIDRWHVPGTVDRALRFMIASGRAEFFDSVWPLITHDDDQVSLSALCAAPRFRPTILGSDAPERIATLQPDIRRNVLHEIAFNSGVDGLDLAASVAQVDLDPEVKAAVIDAFAFRRADRHIAEVLHGADEKTFDLVARRDLIDRTTDEYVKKGLDAARERQRTKGISTYDRLRAIVYGHDDEDHSSVLTSIIKELQIDDYLDAAVQLIYQARARYSRAIADGLLQRLRAGRTLFYGAHDILAAAELSLEDEELLEIAVAKNQHHDRQAEAAASVLGPQAIGRMIEVLLKTKSRVRDTNGRYDQVASDHYHGLLRRIAHTQTTGLVTAVRNRSAKAGNEEMADLADLISRHLSEEKLRSISFDDHLHDAIVELAEDWGVRMLSSGDDVTRSQLSSIVRLASRAPSVRLLPLLKRLLIEELRRYRVFLEEAEAAGWAHGKAVNEARTLHTHEYQRAFESINFPETAALMREYLLDEQFGKHAALVLASQWSAANEPNNDQPFSSGPNFSNFEEKRALCATDPTASSAEAEAIFDTIELLIDDNATEEQKKLAVALGIIAVRLPHGQRDTTIQKLLSLADRPARADLLQNLVLSGETIELEIVRDGIVDLLEAAKTAQWLLSQDGYELKQWLRLLPFTNCPNEALTIVGDLPDKQRRPDFLEGMVAAFGAISSHDAENVLFQLAETDHRFYSNRTWLRVAMCREKVSFARRTIDLAAKGVFNGKRVHNWQLAREIGGLIGEHGELRAYVYELLEQGPRLPGFELLAQVVAEQPDTEGLLLLVKIESEHKLSFISWRTIENVVTKHVPSTTWSGAYNIVPTSSADIRRELLNMTTDGGATDIAARCLEQIDTIRDEYGATVSDKRHPNLESGRTWPIL